VKAEFESNSFSSLAPATSEFRVAKPQGKRSSRINLYARMTKRLKFRSKLLKEDRLGSRALSLSPGEEELNDFSRYSFSYR
jgi:hypothetical protein